MGDYKNIKGIKIPKWLLEGRANHSQNMLPKGTDWPSSLCGNLKSHPGFLIFLIFLWSSHQVGMKSVFKTSSDFFCYFNAHCGPGYHPKRKNHTSNWKDPKPRFSSEFTYYVLTVSLKVILNDDSQVLKYQSSDKIMYDINHILNMYVILMGIWG